MQKSMTFVLTGIIVVLVGYWHLFEVPHVFFDVNGELFSKGIRQLRKKEKE